MASSDLTPGLGPTRGKRLVEFFGSIDAVFNVSLTELEAARLPAPAAQSLGMGRSLELANDEVARAKAAGIQLVAQGCPTYPSRWRQIYDPPLVLYVRGNMAAALSQPGIAVVGTRHPTPYGVGMAERLACDLAARGLVIFSGLARGVDTAAHRGAVAGKGKTVAVFGIGVDVMYPKENSRLTEQMLSLGGALISEFPLGTFAAHKIFQSATASSVGSHSECWCWKPPNTVARASPPDVRWSRIARFSRFPGNVTNKNSWGPNTAD